MKRAMKRALLLCAAFAIVHASAWAASYSWSGASGPWQTATNWSPNGVPSSLTGDSAYVGNGGSFTTTGPVSVGSLRVMGSSSFNMSNYALTTTTDNAGTGDFFYDSSLDPTNVATLNVYGNFYYRTGSAVSPFVNIHLWGANQGFASASDRYFTGTVTVHGTGAYDNVSYFGPYASRTLKVLAGARLGNTACTWQMGNLRLDQGQANLPDYKAPVDFTYYGSVTDNGTLKAAITGGVLYPQDIGIGQGWASGQATPLTWRIRNGSFTARNFRMQTGGLQSGRMEFSSIENGTANSVNFNLTRDMLVGNQDGTEITVNTPIVVARFNNSTVHIGGSLVFGRRSDDYYIPNGTGDLGNATIYVGQDLTIYNPHPNKLPGYTRTLDNWNAGTSTIICDGNGPVNHYTQTLTTYSKDGFRLNNLVVRNPGGTVQLANGPEGALVLTGNLVLDCGIFKDNDRAISFNGTHLLKVDPSVSLNPGSSPAGYFDNLIFLAGSVNSLGSNIFADNIELRAGSKIYLLGFTLKGDGKTWISDQVDNTGVAYDQGTIYGTLVVPEPATLLLLGTGLLGALGYARRRRMK